MKSLDFMMRKIMDTQLSILGSGGQDNPLREVSLSEYDMGTNLIEVSSGTGAGDLEISRSWVQGTLTKIPSIILTRGEEGLTQKKGIYTVFVKTLKGHGEYVNEALSSEIEKHFAYNLKLKNSNYLLTINKTWQQPNIFLNGSDGRYWNRIFIGCEIYHNNN